MMVNKVILAGLVVGLVSIDCEGIFYQYDRGIASMVDPHGRYAGLIGLCNSLIQNIEFGFICIALILCVFCSIYLSCL